MRIVIPGTPISKARHKCGCKGVHPFAYDPQVSKDMKMIKQLILSEFICMTNSDNREIVIEAHNLTMAKSFDVQCVFGFTTPRSLTVGQKNDLLWGFENMITKPDLDNLVKMYFDCGTGIVWEDDAKITRQSSRKIYSENAFVEIQIVANKELNTQHGVRETMKNISPSELRELVADAKELSKIPVGEIERDLLTYNGINYGTTLTSCARSLREFSVKHSKTISKIAKSGE